ncbi:MAG: VOC family protein [Leucobacter sp.]|nr:VOC family protein [Leucobacter sp.]
MTQKIVPNIWFHRNAAEAGDFYASAFENASARVESRYPTEGLLDFQQEFAGDVLTVSLTISGYHFSLINAGPEFVPTPALSFMLNFDPLLFDGDADLARASLDRLWSRLTEGGTILMPLTEYPFSEHYGWVQDRYGVSWQLMLTDPAGDPRPFILPALLFSGPAQNQAAAAVDHYVEVFASAVGSAAHGARVRYVEPHGPAIVGAVQFSDFRLGEQWFVAMDSAAEQPFTFTPGVSLEVKCRDQREIDHYFDALSAVPDDEQCGWLTDRFGVSWQIIPEQIEALLQRPGAFEHMLEMKKLVIADF